MEDTEAANSSETKHLWEESWDDDDTSDDFSQQLKYVAPPPPPIKAFTRLHVYMHPHLHHPAPFRSGISTRPPSLIQDRQLTNLPHATGKSSRRSRSLSAGDRRHAPRARRRPGRNPAHEQPLPESTTAATRGTVKVKVKLARARRSSAQNTALPRRTVVMALLMITLWWTSNTAGRRHESRRIRTSPDSRQAGLGDVRHALSVLPVSTV